MQLGLISLQQMDPVALATPLIEPLAVTTGPTVAVPVFDGNGAIALSLTAIGPTPGFDYRATGAVATPLRAAAAQLSRRLGQPAQR